MAEGEKLWRVKYHIKGWKRETFTIELFATTKVEAISKMLAGNTEIKIISVEEVIKKDYNYDEMG